MILGRSPNPPAPVIGPQPPGQISATETYSENILGPVSFKLSDLRILASIEEPELPKTVAKANMPQIIASDEQFYLRVDVEFHPSPLTELLLCLGTKVEINFCAEGCGGIAAEQDLTASIYTVKDQFKYTVTWQGTPSSAGLTPGFYAVAAIATIGPVKHPCSQHLFGAGYLAGIFFQVYQKP
jgi:hypothetical protein